MKQKIPPVIMAVALFCAGCSTGGGLNGSGPDPAPAPPPTVAQSRITPAPETTVSERLRGMSNVIVPKQMCRQYYRYAIMLL